MSVLSLDLIKDLIDRLDKRPLVVMLALAISHGIWMTLNYKESQEQRIKDLKELKFTQDETIKAQQKALGLQDTLIQFYGRELLKK